MTDAFSVPANDPALRLWNQIDEGLRIQISRHLAGPPVQIGNLAHGLGLQVLSAAMPSEISGQIRQRPEDLVYEIKVNLADAAVRQRFTVAHEIGHFLLHKADIDGDGITDTILYRSSLSDKKEAEANRIAAFLLLPWNATNKWAQTKFGEAVQPKHLSEIARAWHVSELTAGFRFGF
ncbi:ImmA/IrrE family metallo-endopeptidase [Alteriqipengyuania sp. WL0013]|uniref:ImmA/IrrE family metallo-endopeptidase n=1 Tax=Alteriqipengyuania sp. WL0013 TaxID=3110773 RepID=UPI002B8BECDF|nr:ImmA/IrrE family metallo-endopeptidase [Alteriqipengyuania sp. WL0013]MEB3416848.1 ImmA/IrrE family metallo-endopeptidase [Alteriqipengyuania sp. WL0013]